MLWLLVQGMHAYLKARRVAVHSLLCCKMLRMQVKMPCMWLISHEQDDAGTEA